MMLFLCLSVNIEINFVLYENKLIKPMFRTSNGDKFHVYTRDVTFLLYLIIVVSVSRAFMSLNITRVLLYVDSCSALTKKQDLFYYKMFYYADTLFVSLITWRRSLWGRTVSLCREFFYSETKYMQSVFTTSTSN